MPVLQPLKGQLLWNTIARSLAGVGTPVGEVNAVAWMRMMGRESVEYHRKTVIERGDDHPGQALAYYASLGETPLVWAGSGADGLGLAGAVTGQAYEAIFGPGGARCPQSGERLVKTTRP